MENPEARQPGGVRKYMMPTALERQGDFSQTLDSGGKLIVIKDPLTGVAFPGNVIPKDRINPSALAIMNLMPLPNRTNRAETAGLYNFIRQETPEKPRLNNVTKVDWRRTANDNVSVAFNSFISVQKGSEITAGPEKFGYLAAKYDFGNNFVTVGHHHIFGASLVNEAYGGVRRQTEGFGTATGADLQGILKKNIGFDVGQFHPELNPLGVMPLITLGLGNSGAGVSNSNFTYDQRLGETAHDWLSSATDTLTWLRGNHAVKTGVYLEYMRNNEARGGLWMGQFDFTRSTSNPLDTNYAYSNLELGVFKQYDEVDHYRSTRNRHWQSEWFTQDTWRARPRLTLDYGMRFLWYTPYYQANKRTAAFVPELHASAGVYHNAVLGGGSQGNLQGPPYFNQSTIFYNTLDNFMAPGATLSGRPVGVNGLERDAATPVAYRFSSGIQQEIGWGTVVDVSYVGALNRHLEMQTNINYIPAGPKFVDLHPENIDPRNGRALPDDFLRPYRGYQGINI